MYLHTKISNIQGAAEHQTVSHGKLEKNVPLDYYQ